MAVLTIWLAIGSTAEAAPSFDVEASLQVTGSVQFMGTVNATGIATGLILETTAVEAFPQVRLAFEGAGLRLMNFPYTVSGDSSGGTVQPRVLPLAAEEVWSETASGSLNLAETAAKASYRILPRDEGGTLEVSLKGPRHVTILPPQDWSDRALPENMGPMLDALDRSLVPSGPAGLLQANGSDEIQLLGETFALLFGGTFLQEWSTGGQRLVETGERLNHTKTVTDPSGTVGTWWYDRYMLVVEGAAVASFVRGSDGASPETALRSVEGTWDGDLSFAGVNGAINVDGENLTPDPRLLQTIGSFSGRGDYGENASRWDFEGPATFVGIDGVAAKGSRQAFSAPVVAVIGGITVLALVAAYFTQLGREVLTFITGRNVASPLGSSVRRGFLREIGQSPGVTLTQLATLFHMTTWGARYHVRVLKRAHIVDEVLNGNTYTYMLNSYSYRFYAPAAAPSRGGQVFVAGAMAELNHPTRRLLHDTLKRHGACHYAEFASWWARDGVPAPHPTPRNVTYHGSKMEEAGLVYRHRKGPHVVWALNLDWEAVARHQVESYLRDPVARAVYEAVASRERSTLADILAGTAGTVPRKPTTTIKEVLVRLEHAGLVHKDERDGTFSLVERRPASAG